MKGKIKNKNIIGKRKRKNEKQNTRRKEWKIENKVKRKKNEKRKKRRFDYNIGKRIRKNRNKIDKPKGGADNLSSEIYFTILSDEWLRKPRFIFIDFLVSGFKMNGILIFNDYCFND